MKNISFFKKLKLFRFYKKVLNDNRNQLEQKFGLRIDRSYRVYTVLNIPEEIIGEAYTLKKSDIDRISEVYIKEYTRELSQFLGKLGVGELCDFYEMKKVDKFSWLLVMGYSLFRSNEWYDKLRFRYLPISVITSIIIGLLIYFL